MGAERSGWGRRVEGAPCESPPGWVCTDRARSSVSRASSSCSVASVAPSDGLRLDDGDESSVVPRALDIKDGKVLMVWERERPGERLRTAGEGAGDKIGTSVLRMAGRMARDIPAGSG